ncbi:IclR family transcriptional regulator [Paenibacillus hemerocallicola]|uniref:IclR family transcriptional regulator n=1 Tax=Paenibacillus hemerocallicola TaxID=1172614 RepID=A0A5C4TAZ9_9BACL|nr:IclR family transcriptional regulator [Paenibacillus hemerocallicola]TNJ66264.1 IclR family transcriptional regulator [Paenibacillus hemerocallicola]
MESQKHKVKSADRVLDIFELFEGDKDSFSLTEIARLLKTPPSSTYLLLQNMLERGYLQTDKTGKQFQLGHKLFTIRNKRLKGSNLSEEFQQVADRLFHEVNETVNLSIRLGDKLLYIGEKSSTHFLRFTPNTGDMRPLHATASGKVLLSGMTSEQLREIYPNDVLEKVTDKTISTYSGLLAELEKVNREGFGYNMGETVEGVQCVAAAVLDAEGKAAAAISISIPVVRVTGEVWEKVRVSIKQASEELSRKVYR